MTTRKKNDNLIIKISSDNKEKIVNYTKEQGLTITAFVENTLLDAIDNVNAVNEFTLSQDDIDTIKKFCDEESYDVSKFVRNTIMNEIKYKQAQKKFLINKEEEIRLSIKDNLE